TGVATDKYASAMNESRSRAASTRASSPAAILHESFICGSVALFDKPPSEKTSPLERASFAAHTTRSGALRNVYSANTSSQITGKSSIAASSSPRRHDPVGLFGLTARMARERSVRAAQRLSL